MSIKSLLIILTLPAFLLFSCPQGGEQAKSVTINDFGWLIENIDTTYWSTPGITNHIFYDFFIYYEGSDIVSSDIDYARVYLPGEASWWTLDLEYYLDTERKVIGGYGRWYYSDQPDYLPLGNLRAEIKLKNGQTTSFTKEIPAPGSTSTNNVGFTHSEDVTQPFSNSTPMLKRAVIVGHNNSGSTLTIDFQTNDLLADNGWVWLFDNTGDFVGVTKVKFRVPSTGVSNPICPTFYTNNTTNTVTLTAADISFEAGKTFNDINSFIVVLSDGAQYPGTGYYDCYSLSAKTAF